MRSCAPTNILDGLPMMCVGHRQRGSNQNTAAAPGPAIPNMGLPGGPQAKFPAGRPPPSGGPPRPPPSGGGAVPVRAVRAPSFAGGHVNNPAPPPPPPPNFRGSFPPPPPPRAESAGGPPGTAAAQLAQAQAEMQQAVANGDFERCITLREKVKSLKLAMRELD